MATPRLAGGTPRISLPSIMTWPPLIGSKPQIRRSKVDLPQPDGPTKTTNSPWAMSRSMFCSTSTGPKRLLTSRSSTCDIGPPFLCGETDHVRHDLGDAVAILGVVGDVEAAVPTQGAGRIAEILVRQIVADDHRRVAIPGHPAVMREIDPDAIRRQTAAGDRCDPSVAERDEMRGIIGNARRARRAPGGAAIIGMN